MLISKTFEFQRLIQLYLHEEEIFSYCEACENYSNNYSCPPHVDSLIKKYEHYQYVTIYLYKCSYSDDSNIADEYILMRKNLDAAISAYELHSNTRSLIPGRCLLCEPCKLKTSEKCAYPLLMRHSLETLGFNLSDILENEFDMSFSWDSNEITYVFGFLSNTKIDDEFGKFLKKIEKRSK